MEGEEIVCWMGKSLGLQRTLVLMPRTGFVFSIVGDRTEFVYLKGSWERDVGGNLNRRKSMCNIGIVIHLCDIQRYI